MAVTRASFWAPASPSRFAKRDARAFWKGEAKRTDSRASRSTGLPSLRLRGSIPVGGASG